MKVVIWVDNFGKFMSALKKSICAGRQIYDNEITGEGRKFNIHVDNERKKEKKTLLFL